MVSAGFIHTASKWSIGYYWESGTNGQYSRNFVSKKNEERMKLQLRKDIRMSVIQGQAQGYDEREDMVYYPTSPVKITERDQESHFFQLG